MEKKELDEITEFASALLSPKEICIIMGLSETAAGDMMIPGNELFSAYQKGKLKQTALFRKAVIKMADEGSSAAQAMVNQWINNLKVDEHSR